MADHPLTRTIFFAYNQRNTLRFLHFFLLKMTDFVEQKNEISKAKGRIKVLMDTSDMQ